MTTLVLVHGAFGSPAEPAPVIPSLEALGHRAIAVDLPCSDPSATLDGLRPDGWRRSGGDRRADRGRRPFGGRRDDRTQRPQGWAALEQRWPGRSVPNVPRTYVVCTEDRTIPPATQREMASRLGVEPIEIASDHAVFTYRRRELAAVLAAQVPSDWTSGKP